jgi:hypothetical protein
MIPIYVGSCERFEDVEAPMAASIRNNTDAEVEIIFVHPSACDMPEHGCTGFTNVRYAVPHFAAMDGYEYAIYLDVDMFLLADIAELYEYRRRGEWVCLKDGSTEVSVVHYSARERLPPINQLHKHPKQVLAQRASTILSIPPEWNSEDTIDMSTKLLHFTNLDTQPWFHDHPDPLAVKIWEKYRDAAA